MNWLYSSWAWYITGPMITFVMITLILVGKTLGISSNLRTVCTVCGAGKISSFFKFDWKIQRWNLLVVFGIIIGGYIASNFLSIDNSVSIHPDIIKDLNQKGFTDAGANYLPQLLFSNDTFNNPKMIAVLSLAGFLVGFGARYAGGCTSGHAISGLSNLQLPSLLAVIGFFIGGVVMIQLIFPLIF